jgi:DNA (cytosine-5)-methyltransferase 1
MSRPRLLDLFSGAGGAAMGYHRAGFDVVGVDLAPMPRYPFEFHQGDAIEFLAMHGREFDVIHASPPCQRYSAMSACRPGLSGDYPDMIPVTRALLDLVGKPYVIENVVGSTVRPDLMLCGHMLGLKLYRHRLFESSEFFWQPDHPRHVTPGGRAGHWQPGEIISVSGNCSPIALAREAMGIDWMNRRELAESIPPAYTQHIGAQLIEQIGRAAA